MPLDVIKTGPGTIITVCKTNLFRHLCQQHSTNIRHPLKNNEIAVNAGKQFTITYEYSMYIQSSLRSVSTESDASLEEMYVHPTRFDNGTPLSGPVQMIVSPTYDLTSLLFSY